MKSGRVRRAAVNLPDEKLEREMGVVSDTVFRAILDCSRARSVISRDWETREVPFILRKGFLLHL